MPTLIEPKRVSPAPLRQAPMKPSGSPAPRSKGGANAGAVEKNPKRSIIRRWAAAGLILGTALLAVAFVANAIKVNALLGSITSVEGERDGVRRENERLRAELLRLMSVEKVTGRATELGMIQPDVPPVALPLKVTADAKGNAGKSKAKPQENE